MNTLKDIKKAAADSVATLTHALRYGLKISSPVSFMPGALGVQKIAQYGKVQSGGTIIPLENALFTVENMRDFSSFFKDTSWKNAYFAHLFAEARSAFFIEAKKGEVAEIELVTTFNENASDILFLVAREGAKLRLREKISGSATYGGRTIVVLGEARSEIHIDRTQTLSQSTEFFSRCISHLGEETSIKWIDFNLGGSFVKSDIENMLLGNDSRAHVVNITAAGGQTFDLFNSAIHKAGGTGSKLLARGLAGSKSKIIYRGVVDMGTGIAGASGTQDGKFLLSASDAEVDAIPALDIGSPDVTAAHSLSIRHLPESSFFYPMLRGIPPSLSQSMMMEGFLLKEFGEEGLQDATRLIREKLESRAFTSTDGRLD